MRIFVAVRVPEEIRRRVAALGSEIAGDGISLVRPENMHLTLRFIGDTQPQDVEKVKEALGKISFKRFDCSVKGVGVFPGEDYVRVVWAGCGSGDSLEGLANMISGGLEGFGGDERFTAHLTIARVKKRIDARPFLQRHEGEGFGSFSVSGFELIESVLGGPRGPEYRTIAVFRCSD